MGFGVRNCSGWAAFNNFDIRTRPGENPHAAKVVLPSRWQVKGEGQGIPGLIAVSAGRAKP